MNLLLCVGSYKPIFDANVKIALELAEQFKKDGNNCHIIFINDFSSSADRGKINGISYDSIPSSKWFSRISNHYSFYKNKGFSKKKYALRFPLYALFYYFFKDGNHLAYKQYTDFINDILINNKIDYLISFSNPFVPTLRIYEKCHDCKKIYYQCDPYGLHEQLPANSKADRIQQELYVMHNSSYVFTTQVLFEQYKKHLDYCRYSNKIIPLHFPNLRLQERTKRNSLWHTYDIFFLGAIKDEYRDPKKIIDFVMSSSLPTRLIFYGDIHSDSLNRAIEKYKDRVLLRNQISNEEAIKLINSNAFLLNINNSIGNQSPSKLIDYISTGNPIINCVKLNSDISPLILKEYELTFHYYEYNDNSIEEFDSFLVNSQNKRVDPESIINSYKEYTPEFVAAQILKTLKNTN